MSGIVGLYRRNGETVARPVLDDQLETVSHRGPDGHGRWHTDHVGLGRQHLHATPEARGATQPVVDVSGEVVVTADLRIDNRGTLVKRLSLAEGVTDAELVHAAYGQWKETCPEHLVGAFAFAVWDGRAERLLLARDHMGVKPLYYHLGDDRLAFGSEPKAVLAAPGVSERLDEVRVGDHLVGLTQDAERTFYRDVKRLPPAHTLAVGPEAVTKREYWELDPDARVRLPSDEAYATAFRERFLEAVRCRLRSPKPVGAMLSGGLDSSSIACAARELLPADKPLHTVSAVFPDVPECDEREYIEAVLASGDFTPEFVRADQLGPLNDLGAVMHHLDGPNVPPNLFIHWALYRAAAGSGVRVLLDGNDGDTTVSHGRGYLAELARRGRLLRLAREVGGFAGNFDRPARQVLYSRVLAPLAPDPIRRLWWRFHGSPLSVEAQNPTLDPDFVGRVGLEERIDAQLGGAVRRTAREHHWHELGRGVIPFALEEADRAAAAFGIEPRYPFFDKRLVEFCLALPTDQKIRRGWTRLVLRNAMAGLLPDAVRWRGGKSDLSPNFRRGLLRYERERLEDVIVNEPGVLETHLDVAALRDEFERYRSAGPTEAGGADVMAIWRAVALAIWLRRFEG